MGEAGWVSGSQPAKVSPPQQLKKVPQNLKQQDLYFATKFTSCAACSFLIL